MKPDILTSQSGSVEVTVRERRTGKHMAVTASVDTQVAEIVRSVSARMHLSDSIVGGADGTGGAGVHLQAWADGKQLDARARIGDIVFEGDRLIIELKTSP